WRTVQAAIGDGPLHGGADEDRGKLDALASAAPAVAAATAATAIDLVAVVFIVGDPINVIQGAVIAFEGVVVVVPKTLQAFLFTGHTFVRVGEHIPPGLVAAVVQGAPASLSNAAAPNDSQRGADNQGEPFHRDSFTWS